MAIVLKDRVKQTSTTAGTGTITLSGTPSGFQTFAAIGNGNITYYAIADAATGDWEVNYGTYTSSGTTLTRNNPPLSSSNAGALVSFAANPKDVFCTYPSEKAIYEEVSGNVLIDGGPVTVIGTGVTTYTTFGAALAEMYANVDSFAQMYAQNLNDGSSASTDIVAYNDLGDGTNNFIDMGIASSNYTEVAYPIFTPASGYLYNDGGELIIGTATATKDVLLFAGGVAAADWAARISGTNQSITTKAGLAVGGTLGVTGAASFSSTVALSANPTTALQAATKQYVDNQVTAGIHLHEPVRVVTTANLTATYADGGTLFDITAVTGTDTVTTSPNHGLSVNNQIWLYNTAGNGLSANTAYFVHSVPAVNQLTLSLTFGGSQITGLTNGAGLGYEVRANSGVGATLTNSGAQAALSIDGIALSTTNRVLVRNQTTAAQNGAYVVTTVGSGATNWVLTRATDSDTVNPSDPLGLGTGDYFFVQSGTLGAGDSFVLTTEPNTMIIGYTALVYTQFSGAITYTGGTNIDVTGQVISLTGTVAPTNGGTGVNTVTTGDLLYGSAANTWSKLAKGVAFKSLVMDASATNVEWNAVALNQSGSVSGALPATNGGTAQSSYATGDTLYASAANTLSKLAGNVSTTTKFLSQTGGGAVSAAPVWAQPAASDITGLAASATTDTTNASNITTGTLPTAQISGSYTGITGVGTLIAGTWTASAIGAAYGGTGFTSYAVGDLLYADTTTSLAKLADVAVGNALISGGISSAPSWGKIGLATHVSGTLPIGSGGTGQTTASAAFNALSPITAIGDLILGNGTNSATRLAIGANGYLLTSDGTTASWASAPSGMVYPGAGIPVSTGSAWTTSKAAPSGDIVGTTDTQTLTNKQLQAYNETVTTVGTVSAATYNIDLSLSNIFDITLGNNVTFTFTNPPSSGISKNCTVILRQDATGSRLATFTNAKYTDGTAPILSTGANQIDVLTFFTVNGGSFYFGTFAMANVS